ncbi:MAG: hypothetical protein IJ008_03555 [Clostridia bacterium]|nr:hypothetical protein [Clostridia bacterium]
MVRRIIGYILIGLLAIGSCFGIGYGIAYSRLRKNTSMEYVNSLKKEIRDYEKLVDNYYLEISTLNKTIANLKLEILNNESISSDYLVQIEYLNTQINELNELLNIYKGNEENYIKTINELSSEIELLNIQILELKYDLDEVSTANEELNLRLTRLNNSISNLENYIINNLSDNEVLITFEVDNSIESIQIVEKNSTINIDELVIPENIELLGWVVDGVLVNSDTYVVTENTKFIALFNEYVMVDEYYDNNLNESFSNVLKSRAFLFDDYGVDFSNIQANINYVKLQNENLIIGFKNGSNETDMFEVTYDVAKFNLNVSSFKAEDLEKIIQLEIKNFNSYTKATTLSIGDKFDNKLNALVNNVVGCVNENIDTSNVYFEFVCSNESSKEIYTMNILLVTENGNSYKINNFGIITGVENFSFIEEDVKNYCLSKFSGIIGVSLEGLSSSSGFNFSEEKLDIYFSTLNFVLV